MGETWGSGKQPLHEGEGREKRGIYFSFSFLFWIANGCVDCLFPMVKSWEGPVFKRIRLFADSIA